MNVTDFLLWRISEPYHYTENPMVSLTEKTEIQIWGEQWDQNLWGQIPKMRKPCRETVP